MSTLETTIGPWAVLNSSLAAGADPTDLAANERTYAAVVAAIAADAFGDGKISLFHVGDDPESPSNAIRFRALSITDTAVCAYTIYSGTLGDNPDCDLSLLGLLSFTTGTQASILTGYEYASQLTATDGDTSAVFVGTTTADDDRVAETSIDLQGADLLVIVPATIGADCKLIGKAY